MLEKITAHFGIRTEGFTTNGTKAEISIEIPNYCPHCGATMTPIVLNAQSTDYYSDSSKQVGILLRCTDKKCKKYFALQYESVRGDYSEVWSPIVFSYNPIVEFSIPDNIKNLSSEFAIVYQQSMLAEAHNLNKIVGVGYRKSAEILYKDYAILKNPNDKDRIKKMFLKKVIDTYMNDFPRIQSLATSVAYIGNDETHYERRNTDKDLQDLKKFLISSIKWIDADLDVDESNKFIL